uniref:XPA C-terminal domain-containing protein n=2 Tax=Clastoptera arizonana TaxID=38151 RepID=A0A1B6E1S6_9HEMI
MSASTTLTEAQKARIEKNRQKAMLIKKSKVVVHPYLKNVGAVESLDKKIIQVDGHNFVDSGGGFLIEINEKYKESKEVHLTEKPPVIIPSDRPACKECGEKIATSYLLQNFNHAVCDKCQ